MRRGEIWRADLGGEALIEVVVLCSDRFIRATSRALVAPRTDVITGSPWRVVEGDGEWAVDGATTVPAAKLVSMTGEVSSTVLDRSVAIVGRML